MKYGIQESLRDCDSGAMVLQFGTINAQISCKRPVGIILWAQENHNLQYGSQETNYITHLLQNWSCGGHGTVFCYKSANMWYLKHFCIIEVKNKYKLNALWVDLVKTPSF